MDTRKSNSWLETMEILSKPKFAKSLRKAIKAKKTYSKKQADKLIGWK